MCALRRINPPFRADHVGSFLRPERLKAAREAAGLTGSDFGATVALEETAQAALKTIEDICISELVAFEEEIGLPCVTDGEFRRGSWANDVALRIDGTTLVPGPEEAVFQSGRRPFIVKTERRISRKSGGLVLQDYLFTSRLTDHVVKQTMVAPTNVYRPERGGTEVVSRDAYPDIEEYYEDLMRVYREEIADLAAAGCIYVQLDNVATAALCDPKFQDLARKKGVDPEAHIRLQGRLVSGATRDRPDNVTVAMHLCRGNAAGSWTAQGGYEYVAETLFNEFDVDAFFLEYDTERAGDFRPLRHLPRDRVAVLGLVTTKTPENDDKDTLKRRIEEAAEYAPVENLAISPQCGFASGVRGNPISWDDERRKLALCLEVAQEVWGSA